ncbi:MAG TPA: peptidoglycan DD-metalloendopeptidase family protein [Acidimicrobiia bacterium]|jgi:murein DD-endopeptidase MepM/ murein hydrolase activator NlpD|nr:peptidoglycan DD-metalloendopeptidase family protein [Acidimicrobiia bacterium]
MPHRPVAPVVALVVVSIGSGHAAWAAKKPPTTTTTLSAREERVRELRSLVGEASAQEAVFLSEIADIEARLEDLDDAVWDLTKQSTAAQRRLDAAERNLKKAEADQDVAIRRLGAAQGQVDASRQQMNQTVAAMYQRGTSEEQALYVALVQGATNANDLFSAQRYVAGTIKTNRRELNHFLALKEEADRLRHQVDARAEEIRVTRDEQVAERDRLQGLKDQALANRAAAKSEEDRQQELLKQIQDKKADFQSELNALQVESGAVGDFLRQVQSGQKLAPRKKRTFKAPVGAPMSSGFGTRVHPILGEVRMHTGIDYAAGTGVPIKAAGSGIVVWAGPRGGYGNAVIIDHRNGLATLYAHQSRVNATVGQKVSTGQVVGFVGQTGMSTGPHLHFEVRELGAPVDPLWYL